MNRRIVQRSGRLRRALGWKGWRILAALALVVLWLPLRILRLLALPLLLLLAVMAYGAYDAGHMTDAAIFGAAAGSLALLRERLYFLVP